MGGLRPPQPPRLFLLTPCRLVFENPEPVIKVFANGGLRPPTPPAFNIMQAGFQENRTINKNCVKHEVVMAFF